MRRTFIKTTILSIALMGLVGAAKAQWVAFNDHVAGNASQTSTNATTNIMHTAGGPYTLKEITTGTNLNGVTLTVSISGGALNTSGAAGGSPTAGTPLYNVFNTYCYFGTYSITVSNNQSVVLTLSGLNPSKRYKFQAGAVRGNGITYSNRWGKFNISGADSFTANHQQGANSPWGIFTAAVSGSSLTGDEVAINTGHNISGDMVEWNTINPGADGTFSVTSTMWYLNSAVNTRGTNPGTFFPNSTSYGYALDAFRLEECAPPVIVTQPQSVTNVVGETATFTVSVTGTAPYTYQWRKNGSAIANATNQSYSLTNLVTGDAASYSVAVSNSFGGTISSNAVLTISAGTPLEITVHPQSQTKALGESVTFTVTVTGSKPAYQWLKNGGTISGATNASYSLTNVASTDQANYSVRITNAVSSVLSSNAILTVLTGTRVLLIARTNLSSADITLSNILSSQGLVVVVADDRTLMTNQSVISGKSLMIFSSSIDPTNLPNTFFAFSQAVPIVNMVYSNWMVALLTAQASTNVGTFEDQMGLRIVDSSQSLSAGLTGTQKVFTASESLNYGVPGGNAMVIATTTNGTELPVYFCYEKGVASTLTARRFNSRRVALFLGGTGATHLTTAGTDLFKAAVSWAMAAPDISGKVGISKHPADTLVSEGSAAMFTVNVTGAPPYSVQWQKNSNNVSSGFSVYTVNNVSLADNGAYYRAIVSNYVSGVSTVVTSLNARLSVVMPDPIVITNQPTSQMVALGQSVSFSVGVSGGAPMYQWYLNGAPVADATNKYYSIANVSNYNLGTYYAVITNRISAQTSSVVLLTNFPESVVLMDWGSSTWRYNTNYTNLGNAWITNGYNASAWPIGSSVFYTTNTPPPGGYTTGTILPLTNGTATKILSYYFRNQFQFTNNPDDVIIQVKSLIDDGAVYYVNGAEVSRYNMASGAVDYNDTAASSITTTPSENSFTVDPYLLKQGSNVMAVEVHQSTAQSMDVMMGVQLNINWVRPTPLAITSQPKDLSIEETYDGTLSIGVSGTGAKYQWYKNGVLIPGATRSFFSITNAVLTNSGDYQVTVSNFYNFYISSNAHLTVTTNTSVPYMVSADGTLTNAYVLVTFSEPILFSTATNITNYLITNVTAKTKLTLNSAVLTNKNQVLLYSAARADYANYVLIVNNIRDSGSLTNKIANNSMIPIECRGTPINWLSVWSFFDALWYTNCDSCPLEPYLDQGTEWRNPAFTVPWYWNTNNGVPGVFWYAPIEIAPQLGVQLKSTSAATAYFRNTFNAWTSVSAKLQFRYVVAAGAVFYINGQEFYRYNMPGGTIDYTTLANNNPAVNVTDWIDLPAAGKNALQAGTNTMAVELHQRNTTGVGSRALGLELQLKYTSLGFGPILITSQPTNTTLFEGQSATFNIVDVGGATYQWQSNGVAIPNATNTSFTIPSITLSMSNKSYSVIVSNATNSVTSSSALLTVLPDTRAPEIVSAAVGTGSTISIFYARPLDPQSATNIANYAVSCATVSKAVLTNGTNVILTTLSQATTNCVVSVANVRGPNVAGTNIICGTHVSLTVPSIISATDVVPPVITGCPGNITTNNAVVNWASPSATDNCSPSVTVTCNPPSGSAFQEGLTDVTCFSSDLALNTATCSFIVTVSSCAHPTLHITQNASTITLTWTKSSCYNLFYRTNLGTSPLPNKASDLTWSSYTGSITESGSICTATINKPTTGNMFFILK
jgi:hypothetical protein